MNFYQKYELIEPLSGPGTKSFRARQLSTSRDVVLHLLGASSAENESLLGRLRRLPTAAAGRLIEIGDYAGGTFVATVAPPYLHLAGWLAEQERSGTSGAANRTHVGTWRVPTAGGAPAAGSEPGEFTKMFQAGGSAGG